MQEQRGRVTRRSLLDRPQSLIGGRPIVRNSAVSSPPHDEPDPSALWPPSLGSWPSPTPRERAGPDECWLPLSWQLPQETWTPPAEPTPEAIVPSPPPPRPQAAPAGQAEAARARRVEGRTPSPVVMRRWLIGIALVLALGLAVMVAPPNLPNPLVAGADRPSAGGGGEQARTVDVGTPFTHPSGLTVNIGRLRTVPAAENGREVRKGQQLLVAELQVTNGGGDPIRLEQFNIRARVGAGQREARQVTDPAVRPGEATGTLWPGRGATGAYAFALVDSDDTASVLVEVQLPGAGDPPVSFRGSV
jgi:hypothetical protein